VRPISLWDDLRQAEVCDLDMAINVDKDILRLDIAIDYVSIMEVFETEKKLCKIKSSLILGKFLNFAKMEEHFTTCAQVHYKKQLRFGLK